MSIRDLLKETLLQKKPNKMLNQVRDDQAFKYASMKVGNTAGGLIGTKCRDKARDQWCVTYNECACLSDDMRNVQHN